MLVSCVLSPVCTVMCCRHLKATLCVMTSGVCSPYIPSHSCCLVPSFLQGGMTPLLLAAYSGRNAFIDVLVEKYHNSLMDVDNVSDN